MQLTLRFSGGTRESFGDHDYEGVFATALARFNRRLDQVQLYVEDVNGPRGGVDKQCRCIVHLRGMTPVVIEDQDERIGSLIYRVANRAAYVISQRMHRMKNRRQARSSAKHLQASSTPYLPAGAFGEVPYQPGG